MEFFIFEKEDFNNLENVKKKFNLFLKNFYNKKKRILPWREIIDPYHILVSEFMLQQTQVSRVTTYFYAFIEKFPTLETLAQASQSAVLEIWNGLGYNRRALYLHQAAKILIDTYQGIIPNTTTTIQKIKGIGINTAGAIVTYCHNIPCTFVETNIRTVFFSIFKKYFTTEKIKDKDIEILIQHIIDEKNPREWYYALMDLGTELKKKISKEHLKKSISYQKQPTFKGSMRAIRGKIIKFLTAVIEKKMTREKITILCNDERVNTCIENLKKEGFIEEIENFLYLKN